MPYYTDPRTAYPAHGNKDAEAPTPKRGWKNPRNWAVTGLITFCAIVAVSFACTQPPSPKAAAERHMENTLDATTELIMRAALPSNPLLAELLAEIAEFIVERSSAYSCQEDNSTETHTIIKCEITYALPLPIDIHIKAPFSVAIDTRTKDFFTRDKNRVVLVTPEKDDIRINDMTVADFTDQFQDDIQREDYIISELEKRIDKWQGITDRTNENVERGIDAIKGVLDGGE